MRNWIGLNWTNPSVVELLGRLWGDSSTALALTSFFYKHQPSIYHLFCSIYKEEAKKQLNIWETKRMKSQNILLKTTSWIINSNYEVQKKSLGFVCWLAALNKSHCDWLARTIGSPSFFSFTLCWANQLPALGSCDLTRIFLEFTGIFPLPWRARKKLRCNLCAYDVLIFTVSRGITYQEYQGGLQHSPRKPSLLGWAQSWIS